MIALAILHYPKSPSGMIHYTEWPKRGRSSLCQHITRMLPVMHDITLICPLCVWWRHRSVFLSGPVHRSHESDLMLLMMQTPHIRVYSTNGSIHHHSLLVLHSGMHRQREREHLLGFTLTSRLVLTQADVLPVPLRIYECPLHILN